MDSAVAAFESGALKADVLVPILEKASTSPVRQLASAPLGALERYIHILEGKAGAGKLKAFGRGIYGPRLSALETPQSEDERLLKTDLEGFLALTAESPAIRKQLSERAARFIGFESEADSSALNSDQYGPAFTVAVQDLGAPFADKLMEARATLDDPLFDRSSAEALGHARDPELAARVRKYALSGTPGPREAYSIISAQMHQPETREAAWVWLRENFETVTRAIPAQWRRRLPTLAGAFCDTGRIEDIRTFFERNAGLIPGFERQLAQTVERIELCVAFRAELANDLLGAL